MAQAARTAGNTAVVNRSPRQFAIARRIAIARKIAGRQGDAAPTVKIIHQDPSMIQACIEAAGFAEHQTY